MTQSKAIIDFIVEDDGSRPTKSTHGTDWYDSGGKLHRVDGPARIYDDGVLCWYRHGKLHRSDGPAIVRPNGSYEWRRHGKIHRIGGPALEYEGTTQWWLNGELHREDGPAVEMYNGKRWYRHGQLHRLDGPARIVPGRESEYYVNGHQFTEEEFYRYVDQDTGEVFLPPGKKLTHDKS